LLEHGFIRKENTMADQQSDANETSTGHVASEASYLDRHFEAARPEYEAMLLSVGIKPGWRVLDAGCGGGSFLPLLADLVGPAGYIRALDLAPENIANVDARITAGSFSCAVETGLGSVVSLAYPENSFDAVWCANVTQYLDDKELTTALTEFLRVVCPGGLVSLKEQEATSFLMYPSDPALLWHVFEADRPRSVQVRGVLRAHGLHNWLKKLGLVEVWQRTTLIERWAPLRPVERESISDILSIMADFAEEGGVPEVDLAIWRMLRDPTSPENVLNHPEFYWREGHVVTVGRVPRDI
jgi:ubiquinone/menaquinone biosynthesis C-methylase UbiE